MAPSSMVTNTHVDDLPFIYDLFNQSVLYQEKKGFPGWRNYDKDAIVRDLDCKNQYKIVINSTIAIVFSITYCDQIIWRALDRGDSIYIHRVVINPEFKGQKMFGLILKWAIEHIKTKGLKSIRMGAATPNIISYYKTFGFDVVEHYTTPDVSDLPIHNRKLALTLLEYRGLV
ncbi:MAG: GNAT family N-acetyltransferase [Chryseolinea sp.]